MFDRTIFSPKMSLQRNIEIIESDLSLPKFLDQIFFEKCLRQYFSGNDIEIIQYSIKPATKKGENFASYIFRANVSFTILKNPDIVTENNVSSRKKLFSGHYCNLNLGSTVKTDTYHTRLFIFHLILFFYFFISINFCCCMSRMTLASS